MIKEHETKRIAIAFMSDLRYNERTVVIKDYPPTGRGGVCKMTTTVLAIPTQTVSSLHQVADALGESPEILADRAIQQFLRQMAERKIVQEEEYFQTQHTQLLQAYGEQYIAMHDGQVIDSDLDELTLYLRVRQQYPLIGILIKKVTTDLEEIWTVRSPRLEYQ
jgi:hypothetical protein